MTLSDLAAGAFRTLDPERAHQVALRALAAGLGPRPGAPSDPILRTTLAGLDLPSPIGLAAGFDKDATAPDALMALGFGFVECGSVTPRPQPGNPRPRLFRLSEDRAVVNRMGFNNAGLDAFADRLRRRRRTGVVGANLGANKDAADRAADYVTGLKRVWGLCDYVAVNVSSPNTPGLRALQGGEALDDLLGRLSETRVALRSGAPAGGPPLFVKVAPDLDDGAIEAIVAAALTHGVDGLIVSNTTVERPATLRSRHAGEAGGMSGAPLMARSTAVLGAFHQAIGGRSLALVGVGGVTSGADAYAKIRAGASAVQLYSAMVYAGPSLPRRLATDLAAILRANGFDSVGAAVGA